MKIFTPILTLFAASMAYGSTLDNCKSELKNYSACIFDYTKISSSNLNQSCSTFYSSKCQKYINDPKTYVPSCFKLDDSYRIDDLILLKYKKALLNLICQSDSNGKRCAISEIFFDKNVSDGNYVKKIVGETCKQSKCRSKYIEYLDAKYEIGKNGDNKVYEISNINLDTISDMKKYIQSSECINGTGSTSTTKKSSTVAGKCGPNYGACSKANQCCSKYGYCGTTADYCGTDCQPEYGICSGNSKTTTKATTTTTKKTTTTTKKSIATVSGRCGSEFGGSCAKADECCSKYNYCGTSSAHCGVGCKSEFGRCDNAGNANITITTKTKTTTTTKKSSTTSKRPTATVKSRCGTAYGGACAKANECCSKYGYCGVAEGYCGSGCQPQFGICH